MDPNDFPDHHADVLADDPPPRPRFSLRRRKSLPDAIKDEYAEGATIYTLGEKYGVSGSTIANRLKDLGIQCYPGGGRVRARLPTSIAAEYTEGASTNDLGRKHGVSWSTIANFLRDQGVELRSSADWLRRNNPTKGKGHSAATKEKLRAAHARQFAKPGARERAAENQRRVMADGIAPKVSKLENKVASYLDGLHVSYQRQALIRGPLGQFVACVDFKLDDAVALEVQGDFWHANPKIYETGPVHAAQRHTVENDARKHAALTALGIRVLYVWERDVKDHGVDAVREALRGAA